MHIVVYSKFTIKSPEISTNMQGVVLGFSTDLATAQSLDLNLTGNLWSELENKSTCINLEM